MADENSDKINTVCNKRTLEENLELEHERENCKKKRFDGCNEFHLVEVLAEDARSKTLILHLQGDTIFS